MCASWWKELLVKLMFSISSAKMRSTTSGRVHVARLELSFSSESWIYVKLDSKLIFVRRMACWLPNPFSSEVQPETPEIYRFPTWHRTSPRWAPTSRCRTSLRRTCCSRRCYGSAPGECGSGPTTTLWTTSTVKFWATSVRFSGTQARHPTSTCKVGKVYHCTFRSSSWPRWAWMG